jgi:hypothetical protein
MHTAHSRRTAHAHTRGSSAAAHGHSADTLVASPEASGARARYVTLPVTCNGGYFHYSDSAATTSSRSRYTRVYEETRWWQPPHA